jgi:hypothetical protein
VEAEAIRNGFTSLHAATARAAPLFERLGWKVMEIVEYGVDRIWVLRTGFETPKGN